VDVSGCGGQRWFSRSSISSSSSRLGLSASPLVETPDTVDNSGQLCLNLLAVGPLPPYLHSMLLTWWILPGLHRSSTSVYYCQCKRKRINGIGLGTRLRMGSAGCLLAFTYWSYCIILCIIHSTFCIHNILTSYLHFSGFHRPPAGPPWRDHLSLGWVHWLLRVKHPTVQGLLGGRGGTELPHRDTLRLQRCNCKVKMENIIFDPWRPSYDTLKWEVTWNAEWNP